MSNLKTELLRFKDIVDGLIEQAHKKAVINMEDFGDSVTLLRLSDESKVGINAILELAEELEKDNE